MEGYIYKITNSLNNKCYIGKTYKSIQQRWKEHLKSCKKGECSNRPLYKAINKYGVSNFSIEELGKFEEGILEEKEIYYIDKYDSYNNGYNATLGGDGKRYFQYTDKEVIDEYLKTKNLNITSKHFNCDVDTIKRILESNSIETLTAKESIKNTYGRTVLKYSLDEELIAKYETVSEAAKEFDKGSPGSISRCCRGLRKTYKGFIWRYS